MKKILPLLIVFLFAATTCRKDDNTPAPDAVVVSKDVKVMSKQTWEDKFVSIDTTDYTITLSDNAATNLKTGDIIVSSSGDGLLRKVKSISNVDNEVQVETEPTYITDAIQQGIIEYDQPLTVAMIDHIDYYYPGVTLNTQKSKGSDETAINWDINTVLYDYDKDPSTTSDQIRLEGDFTCNWNLTARIDIRFLTGLKEIKFGFSANEQLNLDLVAGLEYNFEKEVTLATVRFQPIVVFAGPVPVVFTPQMKIKAGVNGYANATITTGIEQSFTFNAGIRYLKNAGWSPYHDYSKSFTFKPPMLNLNAGAEAFIKPEISVKLYGVAGPYANIVVYGKIDADLLATPWWRIYAGIKMNTGVKVEILDRYLLAYNIEILKFEQTLAEASSPPVNKPAVTTNTVENITETTASCGGVVTSEGSSTVTARGVCWSLNPGPTISDSKIASQSQTETFSIQVTGLEPNTTYYIRAYATSSAGTGYGEAISFKTKPHIVVPALTTNDISNRTAVSATGGGTITSNGGEEVTSRGICYSESPNPTISDMMIESESVSGSFTCSLTLLSPNTTYYVRAFATNSAGTGYGNEVSFTTEEAGSPSVTTAPVSKITNNSASSGGTITSSEFEIITVGICWSKNPDPTIENFTSTIEGAPEVFYAEMNGLDPNTTYYVRAFAATFHGVSYGGQVSFTTLGPVTDADGNIYNVIKIGDQVWMAENLKTTRFRNGINIQLVSSNDTWSALSSPGYCWYNNNAANKDIYGALYNWYAVSPAANGNKNICPDGWRVSTDTDWTILTDYLGGESIAGGKLKEAWFDHWSSPNVGASNESGFTALPGGRRLDNGSFDGTNYISYWWTLTEYDTGFSWGRFIYFNTSTVTRNYNGKLNGYYVRCVKD